MAEDNWLWVKETIVGPLVVAALTGGLVLGITAWSRLVTLGYHIERQNEHHAELHEHIAGVEQEFKAFTKPGGRFTKDEEKRLESRIDFLDQRCRSCAARVERIEAQVELHHR